MNKHDFVTQYVLNRAAAAATGGLDGSSAALSAAEAWDTIQKLAPAPESSVPATTPESKGY